MISKKINYFLTLAECLNFTQTAARYEVTQTAVSQYIASLEERIGIRLFDRNRHSVVLTEAGRYYYNHVKTMLAEYEAVLDRSRVIAAGFHGSLKVGVGMYEYQSTEALFSAFLSAHPDIRVDILQYPYSELIEKLRSGALDIIIADSLCESSFAKRELRSRTLFESPNSIVADEKLADRYSCDVSAMMRNECLITNCESGGPSSMQMLNVLLQDAFGFIPEKIAQTNTVNAQLMLVRARHGIAIVPEFVADAQCPELIRFPLPGGKQVCIKLMYLNSCGNEAADLLFDFKA